MQRCNGCMKEFGKEYDVCPHCGYIVDTEPEAASHLIPGTKLSDRYTVGKSIGQGGFGITYIAWDNKINKAVAVKEFFPNAFSTRTAGETKVSCYNRKAEAFHKEGVRKMLDEARRVSQFAQNENIVDIYDHFEENNTAYIVMEYLEGQDLKQYLEENGGKVSPEKAVELIKPVLNALDDMHKENMIHRDISPDNIYLCDNGKVKLLDFGSARLAVEDGDKSLSVMVKKGYAPKEQYASRSKQGPWTDVYAVSATLYKMITGELPSESMERDEFPLKPFADFGIAGYDELEKTVFKGLEPDHENRTKDVKDFGTSLSASFEKTPAKPESEEKSAEKPSATKPETTEKSKKKKLIIPLVAIALVVAIVAGIFGTKYIIGETELKTMSQIVASTDIYNETTTIQQETLTLTTSLSTKKHTEKQIFTAKNIPQSFEGTLEELSECFEYVKDKSIYTYHLSTDSRYITDENDKVLTDRILTSKIDDFDGDGENEMLLIVYRKNMDLSHIEFEDRHEPNYVYVDTLDTYSFYMYEYVEEKAVLSASMEPVIIDTDIKQYGEDEEYYETEHITHPVYAFGIGDSERNTIYTFKHDGKILIVTDYVDSALLGDGQVTNFAVIEYSGNNFSCLAGELAAGSAYYAKTTDVEMGEYIPGFSISEIRDEGVRSCRYFEPGTYDILFYVISEATIPINPDFEDFVRSYEIKLLIETGK